MFSANEIHIKFGGLGSLLIGANLVNANLRIRKAHTEFQKIGKENLFALSAPAPYLCAALQQFLKIMS